MEDAEKEELERERKERGC